MNLEQLANIGELIGGFAVVLSLLYLAYELRSNTRSARAISAADSQDSLAAINELIASDKKLAGLMAKLQAEGTLKNFSGPELVRVTLALRANMQRFESMFFRYEAGLLEERVWSVRQTWLAGFIRTPAVAEWWASEREAFLYTQEFIDAIEGARGAPVDSIGRVTPRD
jgi:hypothetical protein